MHSMITLGRGLQSVSTLYFVPVVLCVVEAALDLCETPTLEGVTTSLQQGVVPRGVVNAGNYTYDRSAKSVVQCVASCCLSSACEVHSNTVYLEVISVEIPILKNHKVNKVLLALMVANTCSCNKHYMVTANDKVCKHLY